MEEAVRPIFDWTDVSEYFPPVSQNEQDALFAPVSDVVKQQTIPRVRR